MEYYKLTDKLNRDEIVKDDDGKRYTYRFGAEKWVRSGIMVRYMWPEDSRFDEYIVISEDEAYKILDKQRRVINGLLDTAIKVVTNVYEGQLDEEDKSYINHLREVADSFENTENKIVAYLYSVCRDNKITVADLEKLGFTFRMLNSVEILLEEKGISYDEYIRNVKKDSNACNVKKEYIKYKLNILSLRNSTQDEDKRIEKYRRTLEFLEN